MTLMESEGKLVTDWSSTKCTKDAPNRSQRLTFSSKQAVMAEDDLSEAEQTVAATLISMGFEAAAARESALLASTVEGAMDFCLQEPEQRAAALRDLNILVSMGFDRAAARRALERSGRNVQTAMNLYERRFLSPPVLLSPCCSACVVPASLSPRRRRASLPPPPLPLPPLLPLLLVMAPASLRRRARR